MKPLVGVDMREVAGFAAVVRASGMAALHLADKAVEVGAVKIKKDARRIIGNPPHLPAYAASITYDIATHPGLRAASVEAEIGPDKERAQGALGNILEYGTSHNAPIPHLQPALDAEAPHFERVLADAVVASIAEPALLLYTTKAGVTRTATAAQIANWTRGSRA